MGKCQKQKHSQFAPAIETECDYLSGWINENGHVHKNLTKNGEPRDIAGNAEEEAEEDRDINSFSTTWSKSKYTHLAHCSRDSPETA